MLILLRVAVRGFSVHPLGAVRGGDIKDVVVSLRLVLQPRTGALPVAVSPCACPLGGVRCDRGYRYPPQSCAKIFPPGRE